MEIAKALGSGLAGAVALNVLHETARQVIPHAPRMDVIGERALSKTLKAAGQKPPKGDELYAATLASDIISNALYYSLVGAGSKGGSWGRGAILGAAAGLGGALLPEPLGLGRQPGETTTTKLLTVAWYLVGGLAAAAAYNALNRR